MVTMTMTAPAPERMAEALRGRLKALASALELIRLTISSSNQQAHLTTLALLADRVLAAQMTDAGDQLRLSGPEVALAGRASIVVHTGAGLSPEIRTAHPDVRVFTKPNDPAVLIGHVRAHLAQ